MAKAKGRQVHPLGELITIDDDERKRLKKLREEKPLLQGELAARVGVSPATISNLETGRHPQVRKMVYAKIIQVLESKEAISPGHDAMFRAFVSEAVDMTADQFAAALVIIKTLKKTR